ncbi:MAG: leucine-rich repeat protein, partial [Clostridia bacterium]
AFGYCYNLATITIPESVAYIGDDAFSQTPWEDNLPNGLVYVGKVLYRYVGDMPINTHLDIAEGTASIYHYAFDEAYDLLSVTIPSSLTLIGQSAFNYCTELYFIFIPNSVEDIGAYAFYNCKNLTIYTEASAKPDGWVIVGNSDPAIIWGVSLSDIATITFNSNGGREVLPIIDITGSDLSEPVAPIKLGFTFAGWYIDNQTFENKYEFVTMPSENLTLHAKWTEGMTDTEGLTYSLTNGDTEYMVTGSLFVESMDIVIPSTYNGKPVTGIAPSAFEFRPITSVFIPDSVTFIGSSAFKFCYMLATVFIGQGVSDIGDYAFTYCNNLSTINVDENNMHYKSIDGVLFTKDGATLIQYPISKREVSYQIPMGTTKIATNAFGNSILKYITIPDGVEEIADSAFAHCDNLQSLTIPSSVISIGVSVLQNCHRLTVINVDENNAYYKSIDGVLFSKDGATLIHYPIKKTGISYQIPMGTTKIAANAFEYSILESITIPEGVEEIGNMAFMDCYLLQSLTIPSSVTSLGVEICARNTSLTAINVDENNMHYKSIDGVLFTKDGATLIYYPISKTDTIYTIPSGVSKIVSRAFNFCSYLTSVTIPSSVTQIESYAFYHCLHLTIYAEFTAQPIGWDVYWNNSITALEWQVAIVFDSNGGSEVTTITAFAGKSLDAPDDPTQEGYSFDGWYTDNETFLNAYTFTTMPGESLTLYARWLRE